MEELRKTEWVGRELASGRTKMRTWVFMDSQSTGHHGNEN